MEKDEAPTIADFLGAAPWKHALFTTYALSLSYFESEVLRPLVRGGCDNIWVIADAEGYQASLLERRSMRVGQEYHLIPAAMPKGVVHAKSIYLSGENEDLLLIGSGNITFGGHGKNAEVFEALVPETAAQAFEDFANYLESFGSRPDIRLGREGWTDDFAERARRAARRGQNAVPPIRLVHSVESPIVRQLPSFLEGLGACKDVRIMSPYHDPDGAAVRDLVQAIDTPKCSIAVAVGKKTPFPFEEARGWDRSVRAVSLAKSEPRFIHAKWYEFDFDQQLVLLAGSINATRKALTTTDNIELGVLRSFPAGKGPFRWKNAQEPEYEGTERLPSGLGARELVYAAFDRSNADSLTGRLISGQEVCGHWQLRLVQADGETFSAPAELGEDGSFGIAYPELEVFSTYSAVQIILRRDEREARGWVHNEMLLSAGVRRRLTAGALSRLMRRDGTDDDLQALLDYLSIHAEQHLRLFDQPVVKAEGCDSSAGEQSLVTVTIAELAPSREGLPSEGRGGRSGSARDDQFNEAMLRLRRVLLGQGRSRSKALSSRSNEVLAEELDQNSEVTPEEQARNLGLGDFEASIDAMIDEAGDRQVAIDRLLVLLLEVSMWMRLARLNDIEGAHAFLGSWFFRASGEGYCDRNRTTALSQHVVTAAAALYCLASDEAARTSRSISLHGALERFYCGTVDRRHALEQLIPDQHAGFVALLFGDEELPDLAKALEDILATKTRRQQLADALKSLASGRPISQEQDVFSTETGKLLWEKLNDANWQKRVRLGRPATSACSFCHMELSVHAAALLKRERFTRCTYCQKFTVDLDP